MYDRFHILTPGRFIMRMLSRPINQINSRRRRLAKPVVECLEEKFLLSATFTNAETVEGTTKDVVSIQISSSQAQWSTNESSWSAIAGTSNANVTAVSSVAADSGAVFVFILNSSGNVYVNDIDFTALYPSGIWNSWVRVSSASSDNATQIAAGLTGGPLSVFKIDTSSNVYYDHFDNSTASWSGWIHVSSLSTDAAVAIAPTLVGGEPAVFQRGGTNDNLFYDSYNGTSWSGWSEIAGSTGAELMSATTFGSSLAQPILFFTTSSGDVEMYYSNGDGGWSSETNFGDVGAQGIGTAYFYSTATDTYDPAVVIVDGSGEVEYDQLTTSWTGWTDISSGATLVAATPSIDPSVDTNAYYVSYE
jgi:hypothetical protein